MNEVERQGKAMEVVAAVGRLIKDSSPVPSGHVYAQLCGALSLDTYQSIITILKRCGFVKEENYLLTWIGDRDGKTVESGLSNNNDEGSSHVAGGDEQEDLSDPLGGEG